MKSNYREHGALSFSLSLSLSLSLSPLSSFALSLERLTDQRALLRLPQRSEKMK